MFWVCVCCKTYENGYNVLQSWLMSSVHKLKFEQHLYIKDSYRIEFYKLAKTWKLNKAFHEAKKVNKVDNNNKSFLPTCMRVWVLQKHSYTTLKFKKKLFNLESQWINNKKPLCKKMWKVLMVPSRKFQW